MFGQFVRKHRGIFQNLLTSQSSPSLISWQVSLFQPVSLKEETVFKPPPKDVLEKLPPLYANDKAQTQIPDTILHATTARAGR